MRQPKPAANTPDGFGQTIHDAVDNPQLRTIILTDRNGDITDPKDPLSDESVQRILGPKWKLVQEEKYRWYYEWRFYIFHTWRTRVWTREPTLLGTAPPR